MSGENTLVYKSQGGSTLSVASGGSIAVASGGSATFASGSTLTVASGAALAVNGTPTIAAGIQPVVVGAPQQVAFSVAAGASNVSEVTLTVKDAAGTTIAVPTFLDVWLSDAATGVGLTATTASGAVAAKAASGADIATLTSKKALMVQTLANGTYVLSITDSAKTGFYVCAQPSSGSYLRGPSVSAQLVTASYGA